MSFTFEDAVRITQAATPRTPLDRLAGDLLGAPHAMQARLRPLIETCRTLPRAEAINRLRIAARNLNVWFRQADAGVEDALAALRRDKINAMALALTADAIASCADAMERGE